jgi:D-arabinose 1-dehydrogenase-like Zn-dependent alcohol dehydrogenase
MQLASRTAIHTSVKPYPLTQAYEALQAVRNGDIKEAAVLVTN